MARGRFDLGLGIAFSFLAAVAFAAPSCEVYDSREYRHYTCRDFRSLSHFAEHIRHDPQSTKPTWFALWDTQLQSLPPSAFAGLNVTVLELRRVELDHLDPTPDATQNPFHGLEDTLRKLTFSLGTLPSSWSLLSGLRRLEELELLHYAQMRLTRNFNQLPKSVRTIFVADTTFASVEDGWIADLVNLEHLIFRGTDLTSFNRNWLPRPAPRFTTLDLPTNKLASFPVGLGDDLPALRYLNLFKNQITTIREEDVAPIKNKVPVVDMLHNPVQCGCHLSFILDYPSTWHFFLCAGPPELRDTYVTSLRPKELKCVSGA